MSKGLNAEHCTVVHSNAELQEAVLEQIHVAQTVEPLAPVTLIVPSGSSAWLFRRQLARRLPSGRALVNVNAVTAMDFLNNCAVACGLNPVESGDTVVRAAVVEGALRSVGGELGVSAEHPETAVRLGRLMDDLRWCALSPEAVENLRGTAAPTAQQALEFIAGVRAQVSDVTGETDVCDLAARVLNAIRDNAEARRGVAAFGTLILVSQHLPSPVWDVVTGTGLPIHRIRLSKVEEPLPAVVEGCPDPATEVAVAVRYAGEALASGVSADQIAIVFSTASPYAGLLEDALRDAGITWNGPTARTLRETLLARRVDALLQMAEELKKGAGILRSSLMRWLALKPAKADEGETPSNIYRNLIRSEGLYGDARRWAPTLEGIQEKADELVLLGPVEELDHRDRALVRNGANAGQLSAAIQELESYLQPLVNAQTWQDIAQALSAAIDRYSFKGPSTLPTERTSQEVLNTLLSNSLPLIDAQLNAKSSQHLQPSPETLRALIDRQMDQRRSQHGETSVGIHVGTVASTRALTFDSLIFVGAADGLLPSARNTNPLLSDPVRIRLRRSRADAPTVSEQEEAVDLDISAVGLAAKSLIALFPRGSVPGRGIDQPSRYFKVIADEAARIRFRSAAQALDEGPPPLSDGDIAIRNQMAQNTIDPDLSHVGIALDAWSRPRFGPFFGHISTTDGSPAWKLNGQTLSASAIESFLHCPHGFFVEKMLGFSTDSFEDEIDEIAPSDLGKLLHATFEDLITCATVEGWLPGPGEQWPSGTEVKLAELFDSRARAAEEKGLTGWGPAWRAKKKIVVDSIPDFLKVDFQLRSDPPMAPGEAEVKFGFQNQPEVPFEVAPETTVFLRGAIDRLDISPDQKMARVIDYKSGKSSNFTSGLKKTVENGKSKIQDLVYSAAIQRLRPDIERILVSFLFVPNEGRVESVDAPPDIDPTEALRTLLMTLNTAVVNGYFPTETTGSMDYCAVCRALGTSARLVTDDFKERSVHESR
jgi:ATP-dependent helicase/nuclease subunit B